MDDGTCSSSSSAPLFFIYNTTYVRIFPLKKNLLVKAFTLSSNWYGKQNYQLTRFWKKKKKNC